MIQSPNSWQLGEGRAKFLYIVASAKKHPCLARLLVADYADLL
jgi:hypothetical protein